MLFGGVDGLGGFAAIGCAKGRHFTIKLTKVAKYSILLFGLIFTLSGGWHSNIL